MYIWYTHICTCARVCACVCALLRVFLCSCVFVCACLCVRVLVSEWNPVNQNWRSHYQTNKHADACIILTYQYTYKHMYSSSHQNVYTYKISFGRKFEGAGTCTRGTHATLVMLHVLSNAGLRLKPAAWVFPEKTLHLISNVCCSAFASLLLRNVRMFGKRRLLRIISRFRASVSHIHVNVLVSEAQRLEDSTQALQSPSGQHNLDVLTQWSRAWISALNSAGGQSTCAAAAAESCTNTWARQS